MARTAKTPKPADLISMRAIRQFARSVARRFEPERIILFGSYAYGKPNADSDVDILVVMPCRDRIHKTVQIQMEIPVSFPMDMIVCTPKQLDLRLRIGDCFFNEIVVRGVVLHETGDKTLGAQGRRRFSRGTDHVRRRKTTS